MKKLLVIGIILLFVGVTIAPTINFSTVKASQEDDLIKVTSQACGITGYKDTTVKLTREQYAEIQNLFDEVQTQLDATDSPEEALPIYYNAIVELNKYGLLPQGMSVETAQNLVTGGYKHAFQPKSFQKPTDNLTNALCFVLCRFPSYDVEIYGPLTLLALAISIPLGVFLIKIAHVQSVFAVAIIIVALLCLSMASPLKFMCIASLGLYNLIFANDEIYGEVNTCGILGAPSIEGRMKGVMVGFTGLRFPVNIDTENETLILLGFSLYAHIYNC
jgi:hypothetical protein